MSTVRFPSNILARILEALAENSCIMRDSELFEIIRREFDLSYSDLIRYLMLLEIRGFIHVSSARENVRIISLSEYAKEQLHIDKC